MAYSARHYDVLDDDTYRGMVQELKQARINAGLSQSALAARIGVEWTTLSRWERRSTIPSVYHLLGWWRELNFKPVQENRKETDEDQ